MSICNFSLDLLVKIENILKNVKNNIVFICMGNYKVNFDSFAPLVAEQLKEYNVNAYVYGGKNYPLYGKTLEELKLFLEKVHKYDTKVFIDVVKTQKSELNQTICVSNKKFQVANSSVVIDYDYSICFYIKMDELENTYFHQQKSAEKVSTFIANYC